MPDSVYNFEGAATFDFLQEEEEVLFPPEIVTPTETPTPSPPGTGDWYHPRTGTRVSGVSPGDLWHAQSCSRRACAGCESFYVTTFWVPPRQEWLCRYCFDSLYDLCELCAGWRRRSILPCPCDQYEVNDGVDDDHDNGDYADDYEEGPRCPCSGCQRRWAMRGSQSLIRNYGYKPYPKFHGRGPLFLGAEVEVEFNRYSARVDRAARVVADHLGDLAYLKEDGSISNGFEIVTHPMSYEWAVRNFPLEMFADLVSQDAYLNDEIGMHVHVSRRAFTGKPHVYRWLKFWYRNARPLTDMARRDPSSWGSFHNSERTRIKEYVTCGGAGARYSAVNLQPSHTFEVRIFRSTLDPDEFMANLGLVDASVRYAQELNASTIIHNGGWEWNSFYQWVKKREIYAPLTSEMEKLTCVS